MHALGVRLLAAVVWLPVACQSAAPSKQQTSNGSTNSGNAPATGSSTAKGGTSAATTATASGGTTSTSSSTGAAAAAGANAVPIGGAFAGTAGSPTAAATGGAPPVSQSLSLTKAAARIGGRRGDQLIVDVDGKAPVGTFASIEIALADSAGNPLVFFDNNWDGVFESSVGRIIPAKAPATASFSVEAVVNGVKSLKGLSQLQLALFDRTNARTEPVAVPIQQQPIIDLGGACDTTFVVNRCLEGLSCSGSPARCVDGTPPTISHAYFQRGTPGPTMRLDGVDPDEDVISVRVDFLTTSDAPILLDLDGDEVPESDHLEVTFGITNQNGGYLAVIESGMGFDTMVPRVGLTAMDSKAHESATQRVSISARTTRISGQTCDLAGFVGCVSGTTCLPAANGSGSYCTTYSQAQSNRCSAAPVWDLSKDPPKITGLISGYSAWEPPAGCMSSTADNRPEAVIKLRLAAATPKLVLSTAEPETQMDTGIVVLPSCTASMDSALGCNDDGIGYTSRLTLTNLAAGDYFIIIESTQPNGGGFGLSASTQ